MNEQERLEKERAQKTLLPCAHCNSGGLLEKKGHSISYWLVSCLVCRASVKGTSMTAAVDGWNRRPSQTLVKLPVASYLLPAGQKWSYVMIHDNNMVSFMDWQDGNLVGQIDVNLGHFFLSRYMKDEDANINRG
jgi:hypothetical protein